MHILDGSVHKQGFGVHAIPLSPLICLLKHLGLDYTKGPVSKEIKDPVCWGPDPKLKWTPLCTLIKKQDLFFHSFLPLPKNLILQML